jgi:uncharacterized Fe-S center protein
LESAVQQIMVGSDLMWICTETMLRGFGWMPKTLEALEKYMSEMGYKTIRDFRDILHGNIVSAQDLTIHPGYAEVDASKCTICGRCLNIGHCSAIRCAGQNSERKIIIDRAKCLACSTCADICLRQAIGIKQEEK